MDYRNWVVPECAWCLFHVDVPTVVEQMLTCWRQAKVEKQGDFGKESVHEESDS
jgi:hypothetical protein